MKTQELAEFLVQKGFTEEPLDSGCNYTYRKDHIKLICYIEPGIDIQFVTIYKWNNNDVKGTYDISIDKLRIDSDSVATMFRKTKGNLPQRIGEKVDTHEEAEKVFEEIFSNK